MQWWHVAHLKVLDAYFGQPVCVAGLYGCIHKLGPCNQLRNNVLKLTFRSLLFSISRSFAWSACVWRIIARMNIPLKSGNISACVRLQNIWLWSVSTVAANLQPFVGRFQFLKLVLGNRCVSNSIPSSRTKIGIIIIYIYNRLCIRAHHTKLHVHDADGGACRTSRRTFSNSCASPACGTVRANTVKANLGKAY